MRLDIDTEIRYRTGERAGFLKKVLLDENNQVQHVVMATAELISKQVVVPVDALSEGEGNVTYIDLDPDQVGDLPTYDALEPAITEGWEIGDEVSAIGEVFPASTYQPVVPVTEVPNVPEPALSISQGTGVICLDGRWGIVDEVIIGENDMVEAFVGRPDDTSEPDRLIPIELVMEATLDSITLNCTLADLPTYTEALQSELEEPEPN